MLYVRGRSSATRRAKKKKQGKKKLEAKNHNPQRRERQIERIVGPWSRPPRRMCSACERKRSLCNASAETSRCDELTGLAAFQTATCGSDEYIITT